jgi:hypothetical protein
MMTRKDYIATSEILSDYSDVVDDVVLYAIANYFSSDNPRFDEKRFLIACGLTEMVEV